MANMDKANKAAENLAQTTRESFETVVDHTVGLQERNVRFAQGLVDSSIKELRTQAESNRALTQELVERAENQRDAVQTLFEESVDAYTNLVHAPFSYYKEGLRIVENGINGATAFPIPGYDELNVGEISGKLDNLSAAQIRTLREYEKRNKNRETLVEQFDRKLRAVSA